MKKKSKLILGQQVPGFRYSEAQKRRIIEYFLSSGHTKQYVWKKFTGQREEHGDILRWMRQYGYIDFKIERRNPMEEKSKPEESLEQLVLKDRIETLERQLREAEMKAIAYSKMIDIAEQELEIKIRKKYVFKP